MQGYVSLIQSDTAHMQKTIASVVKMNCVQQKWLIQYVLGVVCRASHCYTWHMTHTEKNDECIMGTMIAM